MTVDLVLFHRKSSTTTTKRLYRYKHLAIIGNLYCSPRNSSLISISHSSYCSPLRIPDCTAIQRHSRPGHDNASKNLRAIIVLTFFQSSVSSNRSILSSERLVFDFIPFWSFLYAVIIALHHGPSNAGLSGYDVGTLQCPNSSLNASS